MDTTASVFLGNALRHKQTAPLVPPQSVSIQHPCHSTSALRNLFRSCTQMFLPFRETRASHILKLKMTRSD